MGHRVQEYGKDVIMLLMSKLGELYTMEQTFKEYVKNYNEWVQKASRT